MLEYIHIILLLLCVIIIYFIPFQIFNAMYPVFISIGAGFGIPAVTIIAPFVCNLSLATSSTPTNSSTYLGCALTETDVQHFCKKAVPVQTVTNAIVILLALIFWHSIKNGDRGILEILLSLFFIENRPWQVLYIKKYPHAKNHSG